MKNILNFIYDGLLYPVNNGSRSTATSLISHLSKYFKIRVYLVIPKGAHFENEVYNTENVEYIFVEIDKDPIFIRWLPVPLKAFLYTFIGVPASITKIKSLFCMSDCAGTIVFCSGWSLLSINLPKYFNNSIRFVADSIALFESNRVAVNFFAKAKKCLSIIIARHVEGYALSLDDTVSIYVSQSDVEYVKTIAHVQDSSIGYVPIGIDRERYESLTIRTPSSPCILIFTGVMNYLPNRDAVFYFCKEIYPLLGANKTIFRIVGLNANTLYNLPNNSFIDIVSDVADLLPYQQSAGLFVCPLRMGAGSKNKVLQSLACGVPVLGSAKAFSGFIDLPPGCYICKTPEEYVTQINYFVRNPHYLTEVGMDAKRYVLDNFTWNQSTDKLLSYISAH